MKWIAVLLGILMLAGVAGASSTYGDHYPPAYNATYVNATTYLNASFYPHFATDTSKNLTGTGLNDAWVASLSTVTNQRFHIDLGEIHNINRIYYENGVTNGTYSNSSAKNVTVWGSNLQESFLNTTYTNNTGWTQITAEADHLEQHVESDVADPQYLVLVNNSEWYRYYAVKIADNYGSTTFLSIRRIVLQSEVSWEYSSSGTYTWQCPANTTVITVKMIGGGGSGKARGTGSTYYAGEGGNAGESRVVATINVIPMTNYTIIVGQGGANSTPEGGSSNDGDSSSAFGYTTDGGTGGGTEYTSNLGGDGDDGKWSTTRFAINGSTTLYAGGAGGIGYGAGGGGSGGASHPDYLGGAGADGAVIIYEYGYADGNYPQFSADVLTGEPGTYITFSDSSIITNPSGLSYAWDFGDGATSTTQGTVSHIYSAIGGYTVSLTLENSGGESIKETKENYIIIANAPSVYANPRTVSLIVTDFWNNPIPDLLVNVTPLNATIPASWFVEYYGFGSGVTLTTTGFSGFVGSDGSFAAPLSESIQYNITFSGGGITTYTQTFYPVKDTYYIRIPTSAVYTTPTPGSNYISYTMANVTINSTYEFFNITYQDTSGGTSGITFKVSNQNGTVLYSGSQAGFGTAATTLSSGALAHGVGETYTYTLSAPQTQLTFVNETKTVSWYLTTAAGLSAFPSWVANWFAIGLLVLVSATFSFVSRRFALVIVPIIAVFMMKYMNWITPSVGTVAALASLGLLFSLGVLMYIRDTSAREGM